jgi:predicted O-methyltransferase YrrM
MRGRTEPATTVAPSTGVAGGDWWHCVHSWSPARPSCTSSLSEKSKVEPCATWQLVHVTPVNFYQPIPDTRTLSDNLWDKARTAPGVDLNEAVQCDFLKTAFPRFRDEYDALPHKPTDDQNEFFLENDFFGGTDALVLYCMVRHFRPSVVLEVGSGASSLLTAKAALRNENTQLICIEPYPDDRLRAGFPGLTRLIQERVQDVGLATFEQLKAGDILFIDSSHVVAIGSDVTYLFLEVLPRLKAGVIVHFHDIFLPMEVRRDWVMNECRFWNEQYLLQAFLAFNSVYEVLLCNNYLGVQHYGLMQSTFPNSPWWGGGSFWMRRKRE